MKIAIVSPRYPQDGAVGGCETLLANLAHYAANRGHEVEFLTTCATNHFSWDNTIPPGQEQKDKLLVHYFPVDEDRDIDTFLKVQGRIDNFEPVPMAQQQAWIKNSVNSRALIDYLKANDHEAVICGPYLFGITHAVVNAVPDRTWLVPCLHDESYAHLTLMRDLFRAVKGILFNAGPERTLAARLYGLEEDIGHVVGMGMDRFESDGESFRKRHNITAPYLIFCGRREAGKGTPLLLDYLDLYRKRSDVDIKLVLTGSGEVHPSAELRPHVIDLGFVDEQEKRDAMAGALAFMHPSTNESFGIVLLEAWLAGRPGLVHGKSEVLRWQCARSNGGLWFTQYPEFEAMLNYLLDHPETADAMGAAGKRFVETEYDWDAVGARFFAGLGLPEGG